MVAFKGQSGPGNQRGGFHWGSAMTYSKRSADGEKRHRPGDQETTRHGQAQNERKKPTAIGNFSVDLVGQFLFMNFSHGGATFSNPLNGLGSDMFQYEMQQGRCFHSAPACSRLMSG